MVNFVEFFENLKLAVKQCYQSGQFQNTAPLVSFGACATHEKLDWLKIWLENCWLWSPRTKINGVNQTINSRTVEHENRYLLSYVFLTSEKISCCILQQEKYHKSLYSRHWTFSDFYEEDRKFCLAKQNFYCCKTTSLLVIHDSTRLYSRF